MSERPASTTGSAGGAAATTGGSRYRQRLAVGLSAAAHICAMALFGTAMTVYVGRVASPFAVSLVLVAFSLALIVFAPLWGALGDVTGRRRELLLVVTVAGVLTMLPLLVVRGVRVQLGVRALNAVFAAGYAPLMLSVATGDSEVGSRGRAVGFYSSATSVGAIAGRVLAGALVGLLAPAEVYLWAAAIGAVTAVGVLFVTDPTHTPDEVLTAPQLRREVRSRLLPRDRSHLRPNGLGWLYVALLLRNLTIKGVGSVVPVYLLVEVGVTELTMGLLLALSPTLRSVTMYLLGRVADTVGRKPLIVIGLAGGGLQALLLVGASLPALLSARIATAGLSYVVHALTFSALATGSIAFIGDVAPAERESELLGLRSTVRGAGGVVGPLLVGGIATLVSYQVAFLALSSLAFASAAVAQLHVHETRPAVPGAAVAD